MKKLKSCSFTTCPIRSRTLAWYHLEKIIVQKANLPQPYGVMPKVCLLKKLNPDNTIWNLYRKTTLSARSGKTRKKRGATQLEEIDQVLDFFFEGCVVGLNVYCV